MSPIVMPLRQAVGPTMRWGWGSDPHPRVPPCFPSWWGSVPVQGHHTACGTVHASALRMVLSGPHRAVRQVHRKLHTMALGCQGLGNVGPPAPRLHVRTSAEREKGFAQFRVCCLLFAVCSVLQFLRFAAFFLSGLWVWNPWVHALSAFPAK